MFFGVLLWKMDWGCYAMVPRGGVSGLPRMLVDCFWEYPELRILMVVRVLVCCMDNVFLYGCED